MDKQRKIQKLLEQGLYHYGLGESEIAIDVWKQALELDPECEVCREYLSIELGPDWEEKIGLKSGKTEPAVAKASRMDEPEKPLRDEFKLAQQHLKTGKPELAHSLFMSLTASDPGNSLYHSYLELSKVAFFKKLVNQAGGLLKVPELNLGGRKIRELNLNEEEGFILSLINGEMTLENILSLAPLPPFGTVFILEKFLRSNLIRFKEDKKINE